MGDLAVAGEARVGPRVYRGPADHGIAVVGENSGRRGLPHQLLHPLAPGGPDEVAVLLRGDQAIAQAPAHVRIGPLGSDHRLHVLELGRRAHLDHHADHPASSHPHRQHPSDRPQRSRSAVRGHRVTRTSRFRVNSSSGRGLAVTGGVCERLAPYETSRPHPHSDIHRIVEAMRAAPCAARIRSSRGGRRRQSRWGLAGTDSSSDGRLGGLGDDRQFDIEVARGQTLPCGHTEGVPIDAGRGYRAESCAACLDRADRKRHRLSDPHD